MFQLTSFTCDSISISEEFIENVKNVYFIYEVIIKLGNWNCY